MRIARVKAREETIFYAFWGTTTFRLFTAFFVFAFGR